MNLSQEAEKYARDMKATTGNFSNFKKNSNGPPYKTFYGHLNKNQDNNLNWRLPAGKNQNYQNHHHQPAQRHRQTGHKTNFNKGPRR